jgi:hypothetical protein
MTQHHRTSHRGRYSFAIFRILALALAATTIASTRAADPAPGQLPMSDVVLARAALAALDAEPELKSVNLIVSVVDRVAVIGGPVESPRVSQRAEEIVRGVSGITEVRNSFFVALGPDPLLRTVAGNLGSSLPPRPTMYHLPGVLTNHITPSTPAADAADEQPGMAVAVANVRDTVVVRKPAGEPGILGAPVPSLGATGGSSAPVTPHGSTGVLTGNASRVLLAANDLKKSDPRFANLTLQLRDGTLVIGGNAPRTSDAWDFAEKARSISGVSRIAVAVQ